MSYLDAGDLSILGEHVGKLLLTQLFAQVLDEDIGEPLSFFSKLQLTLLARDEAADEDLKSET